MRYPGCQYVQGQQNCVLQLWELKSDDGERMDKATCGDFPIKSTNFMGRPTYLCSDPWMRSSGLRPALRLAASGQRPGDDDVGHDAPLITLTIALAINVVSRVQSSVVLRRRTRWRPERFSDSHGALSSVLGGDGPSGRRERRSGDSLGRYRRPVADWCWC
jgi:hypothetical protein